MASFFWQITVTDMRRNPTYAIYYNNWARLFILGIIPAAMLIYLNYKVCIGTTFVFKILSTNAMKKIIKRTCSPIIIYNIDLPRKITSTRVSKFKITSTSGCNHECYVILNLLSQVLVIYIHKCLQMLLPIYRFAVNIFP